MQIRMLLAAQSVKALLQILRDRSPDCAADPKNLEVVRRIVSYAENDVPQPQFFFAFGFSNTKPDCISDSL